MARRKRWGDAEGAKDVDRKDAAGAGGDGEALMVGVEIAHDSDHAPELDPNSNSNSNLEPNPAPPNPQPLSLYSHSRLDVARTCLRKYFFSYVMKLSGSGKAIELVFGSSWHSAMDVIWAGHATIAAGNKSAINTLVESAYAAFILEWVKGGFPHPDEMSPDELEEFTPRSPQIALEMLFNYVDARRNLFADRTFELVDIERPFAVPLDPNDPTLFYVGKLDKEFKWRGKTTILEHKSTGMYAKSGYFRTNYLESWSPNSQIDGYLYEGYMTHGEKKFGGLWVDAALVHKTVHEGFTFIPIEKHPEHLSAWLWTTLNMVSQIEGNLEALQDPEIFNGDYLAAFPMNTTSCNSYGRRCMFADLCQAVANPAKLTTIPLGFKIKEGSSFENLNLAKLGFTAEKDVKWNWDKEGD